MEKDILYDIEAKKKLVQGVIKLAEVVRVTMGPKGRNVVLNQNANQPHFTRDGVTVAKTIELSDSMENVGAQLLKQAALRTADDVGDGTTTAIVLARSIFCRSLKYITAGADEHQVRKGIDLAVTKVIEHLKTISVAVSTSEQIRQVAFVSSNADAAMADLVTRAIDRVGRNGVITIEEAAGTESTLTLTEGARIKAGYLSHHFITDQSSSKAELDEPVILVSDKKISALAEILPLLEKVVESGKALVIIADNVESEALSSLVLNHTNKIIKCVAIKIPGFGDHKREYLQDIAILTGATVVSDSEGHHVNKIAIEHLGSARRVIVDREETLIIEGKGNKKEVEKHVETLRSRVGHLSEAETPSLRERIAFITGAAVQINLAAHTETEMQEMRERLDDAIGATRAAMEEGIVPGGGVSLLRCANALDDLHLENEEQGAGLKILKLTLEEPLLTLALNAGTDAAVIVAKVRDAFGNIGYNAATGKYEDLLLAGVVDPLKVVRLALENAVSIAGLLLSTYCIVADHHEAVEDNFNSRLI